MDFSRILACLGLSTPSAATDVEKMNDALLKDRTIFLGNVIDDAIANEVMAKLLFLEMESPKKPIQLYINSPGGLVLAGLAIMDTMDRVRAPIATHCLGTAHSMAAVILAYGRAGARSANAKSVITFTLPCAPDHADEQKKKDAVRLGEILISKTAAATKRPIDTIRNYFYGGTSFSAQDAVAHGMIDRIISVAR